MRVQVDIDVHGGSTRVVREYPIPHSIFETSAADYRNAAAALEQIAADIRRTYPEPAPQVQPDPMSNMLAGIEYTASTYGKDGARE